MDADASDLSSQLARLETLMAGRNFAEALKGATGLADAHPGEEAPLVLACDANLRMRRLDDAVAVAERAKREIPDSALAAYAESLRLHVGRDFEGARKAAEATLERFPDDLRSALIYADCQRVARRHDKMIAALTPFLVTHPDDGRVQSLLARAFFETAEYKKALAFARMARAVGLKSVPNQIVLARALYGLEDWPAAAKAAEEVLAVNDNVFEAHAVAAAAQAKMGRMRAALAAATKALALRPYSARGRPDARYGCLVLEHFRPDYFAQIHRIESYNKYNFSTYVGSPDFRFMHVPLHREARGWVEKRAPKVDLIYNNLAMSEGVTSAVRLIYSAFTAGYKKLGVPVVNELDAVMKCTRESNSRRFADEPNFIFPLTRRLSVKDRDGAAWKQVIEEKFTFPIVIRPTTTNVGHGVRLVNSIEEIAAELEAQRLAEFYAIQFHECRDETGLGLQGRCVVIDGELRMDRMVSFLDWHSHDELRGTETWTARGFDKAEQDCLADPAGFLGFDPAAQFRSIVEKTDLDIFGFDFGFVPGRKPVVFEINSAMNIFNPGHVRKTGYLRPYFDATNERVVALFKSRIEAR